MKHTIYPNPDLKLETALAALAVLERADHAALAFLLGQELPAHELAALVSDPTVSEEDSQFALAPHAASEILIALEQDDLPRYRHLHERAITLLANRLQAGDEAIEPTLMTAFERLANRLITDDPLRLLALAEKIQVLPLTNATNRQRSNYFKGVGLFEAERYKEALAIFDALLAEPDLDPQVHGRTLNSRARCYQLTGRLGEAFTGFRASLELWRQLGNQFYEGIVLLNMGIVAYDLQDYDEAESCLRHAAAIFEEIGSSQWLAATHNELGLVHRDQGDWPEALAYFEKFVAQRRAEGAQDYVGRGLNNIGEVLLFQGRLEEASAAFQKSLGKMTTRVHAVDAHLNLGLVQQIAGDLPSARAAFHEALGLALNIGRRDILPEVHYRLGEALRRLGDGMTALAQFEAGAEVIEATREPLRDEGLKISLLGRWQQVYEALVLHCMALGRPAEAFEWAERARARAFADAVVQGRSALSPQETKDAGDSHQAPADRAVQTAEVQAGLPADAALLCYFTTSVLDRDLPLIQELSAHDPLREHLLTPARTLLFVLTPSSLRVHECPIDPNAFATTSPRHADRNRFLAFAARRRLYDALLKPAGDALGAERLYIVPHGPLHHVPFCALTDESGQPLLRIGGPDLAFAPSATVLLRHCLATSSQRIAAQPCLAVGYDGKTSDRVLRHTETEATFVAGLTNGVALVGPQPKKEQLRAAAGDKRWLHFACHGRFNEDAPLESYLETGANEHLTAREVLHDWRLGAELVTLSACQTGVSRILRGDEPMGLIRAFLYAGARAVLASQWPVEDLPTFLLMQRFYGELKRADGADPSRALLSAQVWLRELSGGKVLEMVAQLPTGDPSLDKSNLLAGLPSDARPFAHPRFWAAFILVGA